MTTIERALFQDDLTSFVARCFLELHPGQELSHAPYLDLVAYKLTQTLVGNGPKRLIINLPPRTLKSIMVSIASVAWLLGHDPTKHIICASYGQDLADKLARDTRTIMSSSFYGDLFPGTVLSTSKQSVNDFVTTRQGFRMATSVGGVLTGRGADVIILDDILKPEDALSETRRKAANEWYFNTLLSRLNDKENGIIVLVMQRLHQNDLVGEVLDREQWDVLSLPAIAVENESHTIDNVLGVWTYSRRIGEVLHPERDSFETYRRIREAVGEQVFQAQYQQNPVSPEGGLIRPDWIKYFDPENIPTDIWYIVQSWDTAHKAGENNDYSVCSTWGVSDTALYLLDVFRKRLTFPQLKQAVIANFHKFNVARVLIEDKSSGIALIQELQLEGVYCVEAYRAEHGMDKYMRLAAQSVKFESGRVYLPSHAQWLNEYVRELTGFPGTKFDDQVDSTSQALEFLSRFTSLSGGISRYVGSYRVYETW
jgi:predicted phage terminase large subunit-like protein